MGGMRVQATSPSIGAASVRVQGMMGRYTRFLSDGLPLFGQQVGGLGLLQIPPMDLAQVEVIKGAGAMGGVVNRPTQGADGRWTVDGWAPLDGRVFNGGVRLEF
jgi:iron complex outermembrane receptor protein